MITGICRACVSGTVNRYKISSQIVKYTQAYRKYRGVSCSYPTRTPWLTSVPVTTTNVRWYANDKEKKPTSEPEKIINVYYGILTPQIKAVKVFSLSTSFAGVLAQPVIYSHMSDMNTAALVGIASFVSFFTFVTPYLLHTITKKYVSRLDYDQNTEEYIASMVTFFLTTNKIRFKKDEVIVPDVPGMFTSFTVRGTSMFVDPRLFPNPEHYKKIMGYDKPIDFSMDVVDDDKSGLKK